MGATSCAIRRLEDDTSVVGFGSDSPGQRRVPAEIANMERSRSHRVSARARMGLPLR